MSFAYQPFYTGDYYRDTRHLSMLQHGAYRQLLDHCWDQRGPLPLDMAKCFRICGAVSKEEQEAVVGIVAEFFVKMEDGHYNRRMQLEIERAAAISGARSGAAQARWKAREAVTAIDAAQQHANAMQVHSKCNASGPSPPPSPSPTPEEEQLATLVVARGGDAYRIPACPHKQILALYHEHCPTLPAVRIMTSARTAETTARWRQVCADEKWTEEQALDWFAWFFQRVGGSRFLTGRSNSNRPWRADFQWLMRAGNFAKVVEGRYEQEAA